jgi:hypothetical protein
VEIITLRNEIIGIIRSRAKKKVDQSEKMMDAVEVAALAPVTG